MREENRYYFDLLTKDQQKAYTAILNGLQDLKDSFQVPRVSPRELSDIYFLIRMDHPEIFYTVRYRYRYFDDSSNFEVIPDYLFKKDTIREHRKALEARIRKLAGACQGKTDLEKELYVHDFICGNVTYDKLKKEYSHEIIGSLTNGTAVCEGMAKGVKVLLDALGVWNIVVLSEANPEKGIRYRHCWNLVKIDGTYYHLDATFDNTLGKKKIIRYDYVNLPDRQIFRDHEPSIYRIPACSDTDHFYYRVNKLSWTKTEDVANRAGQAVKKGRDLLFHWRGGYLTKDTLTELLTILSDQAEKKGRKAAVSVNYAQAVFYVRFPDTEEAVIMEDANEGEEE